MACKGTDFNFFMGKVFSAVLLCEKGTGPQLKLTGKLPAENVEARFMKDQHVCKKVKQSLNTLMAAQREREKL
jgi:hypothetical protein